VQLTRGRQGLAYGSISLLRAAPWLTIRRCSLLFARTTVNRSIALSKASRSRTLRRTSPTQLAPQLWPRRARSRSRRQAATQPERIVIAAATQHFPLCFFTCRCNQSRAGAIFWTRTLRPHACSALLCFFFCPGTHRIALSLVRGQASGGGKALDRPRPELRVRTPMWLNFNFKLTWPYVFLCPPVEMSTFFLPGVVLTN
jgi:hypothetical protein